MRWGAALLAVVLCGGCATVGPDAPDRGQSDAAPRLDGGPDLAVDAGDLAPPPDLAGDARIADAAPGPDADLRPCLDRDGDEFFGGCAGGLDCDDLDPAVHPGAPERCNQFDDDCDGRVDETWPGLGLPCQVGVGACAVSSLRICRADGVSAECPASPGAPGVEACNGADDDCDGAVDEALPGCCPAPGGTVACSVEVGRCRSGFQTCDAARAWRDCNGRQPEAETCNGEDDDCDGLVDEGVTASACGGCTPPPSEACNGLDDDCDGLVDEGVTNRCGRCGLVPEESCDGQDNDCDGRVDEGLANRCGHCGPLPTEVCDGRDNDCDGAVDEGLRNGCGECGPERSERCNGLDDDCDGAVDEGLPGLGEPCQVGTGACAVAGQTACAAEGLVCDARPGPGRAETCDGSDEDCDGRIDEDAGCPPCAGPEVCNGADDDCDGATDEGVTNACEGCGPLIERCNGEDDDCDGAVDEGVTGPCGGCDPPPPERCNGADDDCDGRVDEDFPTLGQPCRSGEGICAVESVARCLSEERAGCGPAPRPALPAELCNGRDDDCDGAVDEGLQNQCGACGLAPLERCDGADQDCDGLIDEGFDLAGDVRHCGGCHQACPFAAADRCAAGACRCGEAPACAADAFCVDRGLATARCVPRAQLVPAP